MLLNMPPHVFPITELAVRCRKRWPDAPEYPTHYRLRMAAYDGIFETVRVGNRVCVHEDQLPIVGRHFRLDVPSEQLADAA
jgi:hypothetical protein